MEDPPWEIGEASMLARDLGMLDASNPAGTRRFPPSCPPEHGVGGALRIAGGDGTGYHFPQ